MNKLTARMRTERVWMVAFGLALLATVTQIAQSAPQATPPAAPAAAPEPLPATIEFNRDIRPILSDKCFQCPLTSMPVLRTGSGVTRPTIAYRQSGRGIHRYADHAHPQLES
jgi:hypothetical protein